MLVSLDGYAYISLNITRIGIVNHIGDGFLDSQLDLVGKPGFHVQGCRGRLHKGIEFRDFAHLVNQCEGFAKDDRLLLRRVLDGQQGEVIALLGTINKTIHPIGQCSNEVFRCIGFILNAIPQSLFNTLQPKLLVAFVHCFGEAVGVKEQALARQQHGFLRGINHVVHHAQRQMGLGRQLFGFLADNEGLVVAGIAIAQTSRRQIEHANEHGDEHVLLVALASGLVQRLHDACWIALMR